MGNNSRKRGFTTVELVIVIAVIAILAAILIPTFAKSIETERQSAALVEATNALSADLVSAKGDLSKINAESANVTFKGVYTAATECAHATYTVEVTASEHVYSCVYDVVDGTWTVSAK